MELCAGTLNDVIKGEYKGPLLESRRKVLSQIASALEHLHGKSIVHGDIKPQNILISLPISENSPVIKLADFGLSRLTKNCLTASTDKQNKSIDGEQEFHIQTGTPGWMAPEIM